MQGKVLSEGIASRAKLQLLFEVQFKSKCINLKLLFLLQQSKSQIHLYRVQLQINHVQRFFVGDPEIDFLQSCTMTHIVLNLGHIVNILCPLFYTLG